MYIYGGMGIRSDVLCWKVFLFGMHYTLMYLVLLSGLDKRGSLNRDISNEGRGG